jgi:outer membrane receptor protein involved in Fe transport
MIRELRSRTPGRTDDVQGELAALIPNWAKRSHPVLASGAFAAVSLALAWPIARGQENPATQLDLPQVVVIGTTPLPGIGLPPEEVPANVQTVSGSQLRSTRAVQPAGALNLVLGSANVNDTQGNPFQVDLNFRGFTASPVLGTPQGLAVFVDGVRANEALGDTIDWDLVPFNAIANVSIMPGSNPLFGLNTLGGAVSVTTKSGFEFPGVDAELTGGSFGRQALAAEVGGHGEAIDYFLAGNVFNQDGWADHSPSRVRQVFAKTGYQDAVTDIDLSFCFADNYLEGSQTLPRSWLDAPTQPYSWPDLQTNRLYAVNLKGSHYLTKDLLLAGDLYYQQLTTTVFNSNVNSNFDPTLPPGEGNEPAANALNDITERRPGASVQLTDTAKLVGHKNTFSLGASVDYGRVDFTQFNQEAPFSADRGTLSDLPIVLATRLRLTTTYVGVYATDTFAINTRTYWTVSARNNDAKVDLHDQLGTTLTGNHRYSHFNPATGLTFNPTPSVTTYIAYSQGIRVPTAVELTCADPNAPCSLPNAFSSDPNLKPVISKTSELGARGHIRDVAWHVAMFDTELEDDIQFISSGGGAVSAGFFQNVGKTRRRGLETGLDAHLGALTVRTQYSSIDATYRMALILNSPNNSSAQPLSCPTCTDIAVAPGDRIPGISRNIAKLALDYQFSRRWQATAQMIGQSGFFARGDENNRDVNGQVPGFFVMDLEGRYRPSTAWEIALRIENVFDRTYSTFGQLGRNLFTGPGRTFDSTVTMWQPEQFRSVAAPRGVWLTTSHSVQSRAAD